MNLNEKQFIALLNVLKEVLHFAGGFAGYREETLENIYNEIINQQDGKVKKLK